MASGVILQEITADDRKLLAAYARDKAALEKNTVAAALGAKKQNEATNKVIEQWKKLGLTKKQITQLGITGDQRQTASMKKLLGAQKVETRKVEAAYRSLGMTARQAHLMAKDGTTKQTAALRRLIAQQNVAKASSVRAFGAPAVSQLSNYAMGFISLTGVVMGLARAFNSVEEAKNSAMETVKDSRSSMGKLKQVSDTDEEFNSLVAAAKKIRASGAADSLEEAYDLTFGVKSGGDIANLQFYADLNKHSLLADPEEMARGVITMKTNFGEEETGSTNDLVSKALGASKHSITTAEELLVAAAKGGTSAANMGMSDEDILAGTAIMASAKGSGEEGGTYFAQHLRTLESKGVFKGMSLKEAVLSIETLLEGASEEGQDAWFDLAGVTPKQRRAIAKEEDSVKRDILLSEIGVTQGMTPSQMNEYHGRMQGKQSWEVLRRKMHDTGPEGYDAILNSITTAQEENYAVQKMNFGKNQPGLIAEEARRASEGRLEIAKLNADGGARAQSEANINRTQAIALERDGWWASWDRGAGERLRRLGHNMPGGGGDEAYNLAVEEDDARNWGPAADASPKPPERQRTPAEQAAAMKDWDAFAQRQQQQAAIDRQTDAIERQTQVIETQGGHRSSVVGLGRPELDR